MARASESEAARGKFRRQAPVGPYIADFLCEELRLIVELDGDAPPAGQSRKANRKAELEARGFTVLRFGSEIQVSEGSEMLGRIQGEVERLRAERAVVVREQLAP